MRIAILLLTLLAMPLEADWFRGNTHTHTTESDGDSTPQEVAQWYADHGYDFLVITDHNKLTLLEHSSLLLIPGEEITDGLPKKPVHVNGLGIEKVIPPQGGKTVLEVLQRNVDAVKAGDGIATVNHPNFGWAFGTPELLQLKGATLLEIWSGHPYVNKHGPPSVEQMWDDMLTAGNRIWGIAADDAHHLKKPWEPWASLPGQGWIVVRSAKRHSASILAAIVAGDFYASTGVELADYAVSANNVTVTIKPKNGARYRTEFIGAGGRVLAQSFEERATYTLRGSSTYVRARITDSNGKMAWTQPHFRTP